MQHPVVKLSGPEMILTMISALLMCSSISPKQSVKMQTNVDNCSATERSLMLPFSYHMHLQNYSSYLSFR